MYNMRTITQTTLVYMYWNSWKTFQPGLSKQAITRAIENPVIIDWIIMRVYLNLNLSLL